LESKSSYISYRPDLKAKARENRNNMNKPEAKIWYEILGNKNLLGYRFLRQKPIENFIPDFYCHKLKLGIEVDGQSHSEQTEYDELRTEKFEELNIKIVRYSNAGIMTQIEGVYWDLEKILKLREIEFNIM
jgi:very-short-patch-repair endonuclease